MRWVVGVLTWNRPEACRETLRALREGLTGEYDLLVLDNGSGVPFKEPGVEVVRHEDNAGAGSGLTRLARAFLGSGADALLFTEDDWTLERPLDLAGLEPLLADPRVGQVRLALRARRPPAGYWTYALEGEAAERSLAQAENRFRPYAGGEYQLARLLWSNNPFACRRGVAQGYLLTGLDEIRMARPYLASGMVTATTAPGHFRHRGEIRERRGEPGWRA